MLHRRLYKKSQEVDVATKSGIKKMRKYPLGLFLGTVLLVRPVSIGKVERTNSITGRVRSNRLRSSMNADTTEFLVLGCEYEKMIAESVGESITEVSGDSVLAVWVPSINDAGGTGRRRW